MELKSKSQSLPELNSRSRIEAGLNTGNSTHSKLPRIKICGVTRIGDLGFIHESGADTVGINLVATSRRRVRIHEAVELGQAARELGLKTAVVVMDPRRLELQEICLAFSWDFVQLHGMEPPETAKLCNGIAIIKSTGWSGLDSQVALVKRWQESCDSHGVVEGTNSELVAILLDAYVPGQGGGSGKVARWDLINPRPSILNKIPLILAGGLTPQNVRQAISATHVAGVDVASGVEESVGIKSNLLVRSFTEQARLGFASNIAPLP